MTGALAVLKKLWATEPVLVSSVPTVLVTVGVITATQGDAAKAAVASIVSAVTEVGIVFGARSQVTPAKPAAN